MSEENNNNAIVAELKKSAPIDWTIAQSIAENHGVKPRAVVQMCVRNSIEYTKKARVSKTGKPVARKGDIVAAIAKSLDLAVEDLDGLEKASKTALELVSSGIDGLLSE